MKRHEVDAAVGAFVLAAFALLMWGTFQLGAFNGWLGSSGTLLFARFDDVSGLSAESDVTIAGVAVGKVHSIDLEGSVARVAIRLEAPDVQVPRDSLVALRSRGLLGERVLEIQPGRSDAMLTSGGVITRSRSASDVDVLIDRLAVVADDIQHVTATFRNVLGGPEGEEAVREVVTNVRALSADLRRVIAENEERIERIALNLDAFSTDARELLGGNRERIAQVLTNFEAASRRLAESLGSLANVTEKIERGEGTVGRLTSDEALYEELDEALSDARAALREVRRAAEETQEQIPATVLTTIFGTLF